MLTRTELLALNRALAGRRVLSVYVDGTAADPAMQRAWRLRLEHRLDELRRSLTSAPRTERDEFEQCVARLDSALAVFSAGVGAPGWAAFVTADEVHGARRLPVAVPTLAVWDVGMYVAEYIRALKENRPVVVICADARHASVYRYRLGRIDHTEEVRSHHGIDRAAHMGTPPTRGFHTGTRGTAGRDAAQRSLLRGRDRMIAETADLACALAGPDGWILVGGIERVAARLLDRFATLAPHRASAADSLDVHASEVDIIRVAQEGASALRDAVDDRRVSELLDLAASKGLGVVGLDDTRHALDQSEVRELFVTRRFIEAHSADAEKVIHAALEQDADIEEVSGAAAERLDPLGGMIAGLRFNAGPLGKAM